MIRTAVFFFGMIVLHQTPEITVERNGYQMKPGQRYILFLALPESPQQQRVSQSPRVPLFGTLLPAGRFCVDGGKVRVSPLGRQKNPSDGASLDKTLAEIRHLAGPVQLPGRIHVEGAPTQPRLYSRFRSSTFGLPHRG